MESNITTKYYTGKNRWRPVQKHFTKSKYFLLLYTSYYAQTFEAITQIVLRKAHFKIFNFVGLFMKYEIYSRTILTVFFKLKKVNQYFDVLNPKITK